jgi:hypothetical protein
MFTHNGCLTNRWFPKISHGNLTADDYAETSLEALAPHAEKLLLPRGIRAMNQWHPTLAYGQGNDPHLQVVGTYFTCVPVDPHSDDPYSFDVATKFDAMPTAPSLDHVCARQINDSGVPLFLSISGQNDTPQSGISYSASKEPFSLTPLTTAMAELTGLYQEGSPIAPPTFEVARGNGVVDLVRDDLASLERYDMSTADRQKLELWKDLLHETVRTIAASHCGESYAASLGLSEDDVSAVHTGLGSDVTTQISDSLDQADLHSNLAVLSALCEHSRVTVLKYPSNYVYRGLGLSIGSDSLAHRVGDAEIGGTCVVGVNDMIQTIDRYYAAKFAHLVGQLDAIDEGDGTMLDNTAAVWFQEFSDGCALNLNNMPIIQAGSCGGYFKTGQAVNVDDGSPDLHRGNSEAVCLEDGADLDDNDAAGTPPEIANAPINKYYCNLMNAIGVKAGEDGFPAEGGDADVTHFGMYDRTEDFAGGGINPPLISDPGEFEDLRA